MKHIVIVAGHKSHGPEGNGIHDYSAQTRLLTHLLRSTSAGEFDVTLSENDAWPSHAVATADALVVASDGKDGDLPCAPASQLKNAERIAQVDALCQRGGGVVFVHFSLFAGEADSERMLRWCGAHFAWEEAGKRDWYSRITWARGNLDRAHESHPVLRGVDGSPLHEEYYHRLRFHPDAVPLLRQRALPGDPQEQIVAWCLDRPGGGRGFGTSIGHSLDTLRHDGVRTLLLNAIRWSAGLEVPAGGVRAAFVEREDVHAALGLAAPPSPIRVAVLSGNAAHRWHNWPETTASMLRAAGDDPRITMRVYTDPNDLVNGLTDRDVLILNWVNFQDPKGLSEPARHSLLRFLEAGGGLFVHHFANGACHPSLLGAEAGDWPEFRRIVRRVWEHRDIAPGPSGHDHFGRFRVEPVSDHPLVAGLDGFEVEDELYWRQHGTESISPLLQAHSEQTGADEPMLWSYDYGRARVVQCLLGHSSKTYEVPQMRVLLRRIIAWCAHREIHGAAEGP